MVKHRTPLGVALTPLVKSAQMIQARGLGNPDTAWMEQAYQIRALELRLFVCVKVVIKTGSVKNHNVRGVVLSSYAVTETGSVTNCIPIRF